MICMIISFLFLGTSKLQRPRLATNDRVFSFNMLKMKISNSFWSAQHPNHGQNKQHSRIINITGLCLHFGIGLVKLPLVGQPQSYPTHATRVDNKSALLLIILIPRPI